MASELIHEALTMWADWLRSGVRVECQGYPSSSVEGRLLKYGSQEGDKEYIDDNNPLALRIDSELAKLKIRDVVLFRCIFCKYVYRKSNHLCAQQFHISRKTFAARLDCAKIWLDARIYF